jgi:DNA-directed RNA polymerase specialized sigma24 family protein
LRPIAFRHPRLISDLGLLNAARTGETEPFRLLWCRHVVAVEAYASTCALLPAEVEDMTAFAYQELRRRIEAADRFGSRRHDGCVRLQLLERVRARAVQTCVSGPARPSRFHLWVHSGAVWSMRDDRQLCEAFDRLGPVDQSLLWHCLVEGDSALDIAAITGVAVDALTARLELARRNLRQIRMRIYIARRDCADCLGSVGGIGAVVHGARVPRDLQELSLCQNCQEVYTDLVGLDDWLVRQLPVRVLGWWPGDEYLRGKAAARQAADAGSARKSRTAGLQRARSSPRHARQAPGRRSSGTGLARHAARPLSGRMSGVMRRALQKAVRTLAPDTNRRRD